MANGSLEKEKKQQREKFKDKEGIATTEIPRKEKGMTKITLQDPRDQRK